LFFGGATGASGLGWFLGGDERTSYARLVRYQGAGPEADHDVAGYRLERELGRGATSVVHLAYDPRLKRRVALKLLQPELGRDSEFRRRFLEESELAASLDHPNAVPIYEAGQAGDRLFIAMRYVEGSDLRRLLADGRIDETDAVQIAGQIAAVLDAAHARGLVHRDVKPSNILLDAGGHAYLGDFGVTRRIDATSPAARPFVGSIEYASPEQIRGAEVDARTDQYSLACVLYECIAGHPPFTGASAAAVLFAHLNDPVPGLPRVGAELSRALAKDRTDRYESCAAFVADVRETLGPGQPRRRRATAAVIVGTVVLVTAAVAGLLLARRDQPSSGAVGQDRVSVLDPVSRKLAPTSMRGQRLTSIAPYRSGAWVADAAAGKLVLVDRRGRVTRTVQARGAPNDLAVAGDVLLAANDDNGTTPSFAADTGALRAVAHVSNAGVQALCDVAVERTNGWVTDCADSRIIRFDVATGSVLRSVPLPPPRGDEVDHDRGFSDLAVGDGAVWVAGDVLDPTLYRLSLSGTGLLRIPVPAGTSAIAVDRGSVWLANQLDDVIVRVDPASGRVLARIPAGRDPVALAAANGGVWVASAVDDTVSRIDATEGKVVDRFEVPDPVALAAAGGRLWIVERGQ
jgi:streptogramin lyase/tRNA A-37 threonylcarbamoyl transferase component Bud32